MGPRVAGASAWAHTYPVGVTGNTPGSGPGDLRFESLTGCLGDGLVRLVVENRTSVLARTRVQIPASPHCLRSPIWQRRRLEGAVSAGSNPVEGT